MWILAAAGAVTPDAPPEVPYETIGLVLVALITGVFALSVAVVQRNSKASTAATSASRNSVATNGGGVFAVSEAEWNKIREDAVVARAKAVTLEERFNEHMDAYAEDRARTRDSIAHIKGQLGIQ